MSAFLGPIHFWLYNKIGKQEELTKAIASMAAGNGWISDRTAYIRDLPALEDVIDESNIHGWLQDQIHDAETRYADLISDCPYHASRKIGGNQQSRVSLWPEERKGRRKSYGRFPHL